MNELRKSRIPTFLPSSFFKPKFHFIGYKKSSILCELESKRNRERERKRDTRIPISPFPFFNLQLDQFLFLILDLLDLLKFQLRFFEHPIFEREREKERKRQRTKGISG